MTTEQDGGKVVGLTHRPPLPPGNTPGTHFWQRLSRPQGHSATGRIMSMKNSEDTIGNRTRYLPIYYRRIILKHILKKQDRTVAWIHVAQDRVQWWGALVNIVINNSIPQNTGNFLLDDEILAPLDGICSTKLNTDSGKTSQKGLRIPQYNI